MSETYKIKDGMFKGCTGIRFTDDDVENITEWATEDNLLCFLVEKMGFELNEKGQMDYKRILKERANLKCSDCRYDTLPFDSCHVKCHSCENKDNFKRKQW